MKFTCDDCGWRGEDLLYAPSPFDPTDILTACPECRRVGAQSVACDEPDCWAAASCGSPVPEGYRRTCGEHAP